MSHVFYDHLVDWQRLDDAVRGLAIEPEERHQLMEHAEHLIHTEVIMIFVSHLPADKHDEFITRFHSSPHDSTHLHFVVSHTTSDVESAVRQRTTQLIDEILAEVTA